MGLAWYSKIESHQPLSRFYQGLVGVMLGNYAVHPSASLSRCHIQFPLWPICLYISQKIRLKWSLRCLYRTYPSPHPSKRKFNVNVNPETQPSILLPLLWGINFSLSSQVLKIQALPEAKKSMQVRSILFFLGTLPLPAIYLTDYAFYYHVNCLRLQGEKKY